MPKRRTRVIPIRPGVPLSTADQIVADVAYTLWQSSAFFGASPEAAYFTALRMVKGPSSGLFLVPKRRTVVVMKRRSGGESG